MIYNDSLYTWHNWRIFHLVRVGPGFVHSEHHVLGTRTYSTPTHESTLLTLHCKTVNTQYDILFTYIALRTGNRKKVLAWSRVRVIGHLYSALLWDEPIARDAQIWPVIARGSHSFTCHPLTNHTCLYSPATQHHRPLAGTGNLLEPCPFPIPPSSFLLPFFSLPCLGVPSTNPIRGSGSAVTNGFWYILSWKSRFPW